MLDTPNLLTSTLPTDNSETTSQFQVSWKSDGLPVTNRSRDLLLELIETDFLNLEAHRSTLPLPVDEIVPASPPPVPRVASAS